MDSNSNPKTGRPPGTTAPESDAVKRIRSSLGWTQTQMAAEIGVTDRTLQRLESLGRLPNGRAALNVLKRLAEQAGETI